jgi:hypothetical protein
MRVLEKLCLATVIAFCLCAPAQAYADPNAGGILFQLLTPFLALATAGFAFARRQLARAWYGLLDGFKALAARFFRA